MIDEKTKNINITYKNLMISRSQEEHKDEIRKHQKKYRDKRIKKELKQ